MTDDRARQIEEMLELFNRGDYAGLREGIHRDIELHDLETLPDADVYRGFDAFETWRERLTEQFDSFDFTIGNPEEIGDLLVTDMHVRAIGKGSGAEVELPFAAVWGFCDGKPSYHKGYETRERALEAARSAG